MQPLELIIAKKNMYIISTLSRMRQKSLDCRMVH
jgi:hypothetical protein